MQLQVKSFHLDAAHGTEGSIKNSAQAVTGLTQPKTHPHQTEEELRSPRPYH